MELRIYISLSIVHLLIILYTAQAVIANHNHGHGHGHNNHGHEIQASGSIPVLKSFENCIAHAGLSRDHVVTQTSNQSFYDLLNHQWNLRIPAVYPLAYFTPKSNADVQIGVKCGKKFNIPIIPKSGGHSYESLSFGNSTTIIFDFKFMKSVRVNKEEATAVIEPGALIGEANYQLWKHGKFGLSLGECTTVGLGGLTLGGGYGYLAHTFGLTMDALIQITMVDAEGNVWIADRNNNPELFWALKGVGSGYIGIATSFKFKLYKASDLEVRLWRIEYPLSRAPEVVLAWHPWLRWSFANAPNVMAEVLFTDSIIINFVDGRKKFSTSEHTHTDHVVTEFIHKNFPPNGNFTSRIVSDYYEFIKLFEVAPIETTKSVADLDMETYSDIRTIKRYVKQRSFYVNIGPSEETYSSDDLWKMGQVIASHTEVNTFAAFQSDGGAIDRGTNSGVRYGSYSHRPVSYSLVGRYQGTNATIPLKAGLAWLEDFIKASAFLDSGETYQNYVDRDIPDFLHRYYGTSLRRLIHVKTQMDPSNYLQNPQSLPVENN